MKRIFAFLLVCLIIFTTTECFAYPKAKVTAKIIDEYGGPISDAKVNISFEVSKGAGEGWGTKNFGVSGVSDKNGFFTGKASASQFIGITVDKEGYYRSLQKYEFKERSMLNRWEPWNPTIEVVLKKKRNPIPMYMNNTNWAQIPKLNTPVGYDLQKGDWIKPYGVGVFGDLLVSFSTDYKAYRDYRSKLTITFPNEKDGIQEYYFDNNDQSYYKWPFEAPEEGYLRKIEKFKSDRPNEGIKTNAKKNVNYIFRVRTKTDKDGNIIEAKYGKIGGDFKVGRKPLFGIGYYFNPDGTRNLEEDPNKNLFEK